MKVDVLLGLQWGDEGKGAGKTRDSGRPDQSLQRDRFNYRDFARFTRPDDGKGVPGGRRDGGNQI